MAYLQYYEKERLDFPVEFGTFLSKSKANKIIGKLIKYFKITTHPDWKFTGGKSSHCITWKNTGKGSFKFSKTHTSIGVICHELAHAIEMERRGTSTHAKKHYKIMCKLIKYCRSKGYGQDDLLLIRNGEERVGMSSGAIILKGENIK